MKSFNKRIISKLHSNRGAFALFCILFIGTIGIIGWPKGGAACRILPNPSIPPQVAKAPDGVKVETKLTQTKLLQGSNGVVQMQVNISAPEGESISTERRATDMVVVLDRSGSMSNHQKLPLAKNAIYQLITELGEEDRLALITFDGTARIESPLTPMSSQFRKTITEQVSRLRPGGSTNISHALTMAKNLVGSPSSGRSGRILLLSDGQPTAGVRDAGGLNRLASALTGKEAVLSTVGLGLGFNEALMSSLADHGMGNFSYLEHLAKLGEILAKDLEDSRNIFAEKSTLKIALGNGVQLTDASGYPVSYQDGSTVASISTGQLLAGGEKTLFLTLRVPTGALAEVALGDVSLDYSVGGASNGLRVDNPLVLAVVEPARKSEVIASIDRDVSYRNTLGNSLGLVKRKVGRWIQAGNRKAAEKELSNYLRSSEGYWSFDEEAKKTVMKDLNKEVGKMRDEIDSSFAGAPGEQQVKRNRAAKQMLYESRADQRSK